eukprot:6188960-Pleurochrysis_carterae.AAC.1
MHTQFVAFNSVALSYDGSCTHRYAALTISRSRSGSAALEFTRSHLHPHHLTLMISLSSVYTLICINSTRSCVRLYTFLHPLHPPLPRTHAIRGQSHRHVADPKS